MDRQPRLMRRPRPSLFNDNAGVAYAEAVIALPVMILLWIGTNYTFRSYRTQQQNFERARRCVWAHADSGCQGQSTECRAAAPQDAEQPDPEGESIRQSATAQTHHGGLSKVLTKVLDLFGRSTHAEVAHSIPIPPAFGGGERSLQCGADATCNERKRNPRDLLVSLAKELMPW